MHIFYAQDAPQFTFLDESESQHAIKVLRLKERDKIQIINGKGGKYEAEITKANFKKCEFVINNFSEVQEPLFPYIHIAIAPTKNSDRIEWFVEKSIEIGVNELSFIQCQRSEKKNLNLERIKKVAISAMKQSKKIFLPKINNFQSFSDILKHNTYKEKLIAYVSEEEGIHQHLFQIASPQSSYLVLIGPEGDFSKEEIKLAFANNFKPISLGNSRLRTETAGLIACHTLQLLQIKP